MPVRFVALPGIATVPASECVRHSAVADSACVLLGRPMRVRVEEALKSLPPWLAMCVNALGSAVQAALVTFRRKGDYCCCSTAKKVQRDPLRRGLGASAGGSCRWCRTQRDLLRERRLLRYHRLLRPEASALGFLSLLQGSERFASTTSASYCGACCQSTVPRVTRALRGRLVDQLAYPGKGCGVIVRVFVNFAGTLVPTS